jgi:phosphotriesterase-related protein
MHNNHSNPSLTNCTFTENFSEVHYDAIVEPGYSSAGGMNNFLSNPRLTDCTFSKNSSSWILAESPGGMLNYRSNPNMTNCFFNGNIGCRGGGMYNKGSDPVLTNCVFIGNLATNGFTGKGGAIFTDFAFDVDRSGTPHSIVDCNLILTNCIFIGNLAEDGAGIYNLGCSHLVLSNCIFSGNKAVSSGGGICNRGGRAIVTNCTFVQNSAKNGNALSCDEYYFPFYNIPDSNVELINCILWNGGNEIWNDDDSIVDVSYSDIQGDQAGIFDPCEAVIWGEGNIDVDPDFVRVGYWTEPSPRNPNSSVWIEGDYHLKSETGRWDTVSENWIADNVTSPCIDAGDPNITIGDEPDPNGGRINMGAYGGTEEASKSPAFTWFFETTQGPVQAKGLGIVLPHEHIFTDLRGPTTPGYGQADAADVVRVMTSLLSDARDKGVGILIECSSIGVGRNVAIIAQVAEASGLPVVVPTGVYGRANFAPPEHRNMTEDELAALFTEEIRDGIEGTPIKAGFIKIATDESPMSALLEKILRAAGRAASQTGAAIASHTTTGSNAVRQVDILESIDPAIRFIWVHAQNESNRNIHVQLAARGVYIEFDSLGWNPGQDSTYISAIKNLLAAGHGDRILLSHDAGWYQPDETNGGTQKPYTYLIDTFIPKLKDAGVDDATIRMITQTNPVRAFGFKSGE